MGDRIHYPHKYNNHYKLRDTLFQLLRRAVHGTQQIFDNRLSRILADILCECIEEPSSDIAHRKHLAHAEAWIRSKHLEMQPHRQRERPGIPRKKHRMGYKRPEPWGYK